MPFPAAPKAPLRAAGLGVEDVASASAAASPRRLGCLVIDVGPSSGAGLDSGPSGQRGDLAEKSSVTEVGVLREEGSV